MPLTVGQTVMVPAGRLAQVTHARMRKSAGAFLLQRQTEQAQAYREAKADADKLQKEEDEAASARKEKEEAALRQNPENPEYWREKWQAERQSISLRKASVSE